MFQGQLCFFKSVTPLLLASVTAEENLAMENPSYMNMTNCPHLLLSRFHLCLCLLKNLISVSWYGSLCVYLLGVHCGSWMPRFMYFILRGSLGNYGFKYFFSSLFSLLFSWDSHYASVASLNGVPYVS